MCVWVTRRLISAGETELEVPLDPDCPFVVREVPRRPGESDDEWRQRRAAVCFRPGVDDEGWKGRHASECERCNAYGWENVKAKAHVILSEEDA